MLRRIFIVGACIVAALTAVGCSAGDDALDSGIAEASKAEEITEGYKRDDVVPLEDFDVLDLTITERECADGRALTTYSITNSGKFEIRDLEITWWPLSIDNELVGEIGTKKLPLCITPSARMEIQASSALTQSVDATNVILCYSYIAGGKKFIVFLKNEAADQLEPMAGCMGDMVLESNADFREMDVLTFSSPERGAGYTMNFKNNGDSAITSLVVQFAGIDEGAVEEVFSYRVTDSGDPAIWAGEEGTIEFPYGEITFMFDHLRVVSYTYTLSSPNEDGFTTIVVNREYGAASGNTPDDLQSGGLPNYPHYRIA